MSMELIDENEALRNKVETYEMQLRLMGARTDQLTKTLSKFRTVLQATRNELTSVTELNDVLQKEREVFEELDLDDVSLQRNPHREESAGIPEDEVVFRINTALQKQKDEMTQRFEVILQRKKNEKSKLQADLDLLSLENNEKSLENERLILELKDARQKLRSLHSMHQAVTK
ncbi:hypothetical protein PCE1_003439 [Barthelona sp. PCE]